MTIYTNAPVFAHDQLYRLGATQYYTGEVTNADSLLPADYRAWAKAAFANTSHITAISVYSSNGKTHVVINTKRQSDMVYLAMQNDINFAMLPIETSLGDVTPTEEEPCTNESALVTTFLNSAFWAVPSPIRTIHAIRALQASPVVTLATFNHAVPSPLENGVIPHRTSLKVLRQAAKRKIDIVGLYRTPVRAEHHKVRSDQFGTLYFQAEVEGLVELAFEMGADMEDAIALMPSMESTQVRATPDGPMMQVVSEFKYVYVAGVII